MRYLHTMVRVTDIEKSLYFYCKLLGLKEMRRIDRPEHKYSLVFVAAEQTPDAEIELTYNYDPEEYTGGRNFGHLAFRVNDIYESCQRLMDGGVTINRPPGMAEWHSLDHPMAYPLNYSKKESLWNPQSPGLPWKIPENGKLRPRLYSSKYKSLVGLRNYLHPASDENLMPSSIRGLLWVLGALQFCRD